VKNWLLLYLLSLSIPGISQSPAPTERSAVVIDTSYAKAVPLGAVSPDGRKWLVGAATVGGFGGSFIFLDQAWYKGYPRSAFHTFNDAGEWQQMDKTGHGWTAYTMSRLTTCLWDWAGVSHKTAVILGSSESLLYMLSIEYLDGRSAEWGWSWPDAGADLTGTLLYAAQELGWKEQRIQFKFSTHYKDYGDAALNRRADQLFGTSLPERFLKDYNAQSYWLSFNIRSFLPGIRLPEWLNIAAGYGAEGMFGGYSNIAYDKNGNIIFDRTDLPRYRQWYVAPDIDLTRIRTKSKLVKTLLSTFNAIKFPAPALELSRGKLKFRVIGF
jgi:uncharacterized protein YfiM (DUF2279 family)